MHGPSSSLTSPFDYPTIDFVDSVLPTLSGVPRRRYKRARNRALALWGEAGILWHEMKVIAPPAYDTESPDYPSWEMTPEGPIATGDENAFMRGLLVPGAVHLLPMYEDWVGSSVPATGYLFNTGGFAIWNVNHLKSLDRADMRYIVCHEIGHSIGLGHQYQRYGGNPGSVMYVSDAGYRGTSSLPDAHDLISLRGFYA